MTQWYQRISHFSQSHEKNEINIKTVPISPTETMTVCEKFHQNPHSSLMLPHQFKIAAYSARNDLKPSGDKDDFAK